MKSTALPAPLRVSCAGLLSAAYVVLCTLLLVVGGFPSGMMVRQHNRRVRAMWRPRET